MKFFFPAFVLWTLGLSLHADEPATPAFTSTASVHDPAVVRDGSMYYVFGSHMASASSSDLMNWTQITTSAAAPNSLIRNQNPQTEFSEALAWAQTTTFWAPDVIKLGDGRYYYYYCACRGDAPLSALGLARADTVAGPYANVGILLKSGMVGLSPAGVNYDVNIHPNVVDPSVFFDKTGKLWMVYGSFSGGIFILALDSTPGSPTIGQPLANQNGYGKKLIGGNSSRIEGPTIFYSPETDYYYLLMTFGGLDANGGYNVRIGRSRNPDGPFLDPTGNDLTNVKGNFAFDDATIAPFGGKLMGNWQFAHVSNDAGTTSRGYVSPGGVSVYHDVDAKKYLLVFHTRFVGRGEVHEVRVHQFFLNEDGWPVVVPQRYAQETIRTTDVGQVAGSYKLINHGKDITAAVKTSSLVTLGADRSVSGAVTGTWQLSGGHDITLTLGGTTYRGVFVRAWDDDNQMWVQTFTAMAGDGVTIWGSKVTAAAALSITAQPGAQTVAVGQSVTFSVATTGTPAPTYQWKKDGVAIAGATGSAYSISNVAKSHAGSYTVTITNSQGSVTSSAAALTVTGRPEQVFVPTGNASAQIVNLSTRGIVATGDDVLIAGFVISGSAPKKLLILASGRNLARLFNLSGEIGRPKLTLVQSVNGTNVTVAENNDWQQGGAELPTLITQVGAQQLTVSSDPAHGDAGIVMTLAPGVYTVVVAPDAKSANQDGIGLVEIYDVTPSDGSRLVNISSRGRIETGARQMIVGVVVNGSGSSRLMIRAVGPGLKPFGLSRYLGNPSQTLYHMVNGQAVTVGTNDDWWSSAQADQVVDLSPKLGAFALDNSSADSVLLELLPTGVYTAVIAPSNDTPGIALAEIYDTNGR
jgi:arabinan endo-1,5-alpha-L-arabinosidase